MTIPQDPFILYSYLNTQLRDHYSSLEEFCKAKGCNSQELCQKLSEAGFKYSPETNRFG